MSVYLIVPTKDSAAVAQRVTSKFTTQSFVLEGGRGYFVVYDGTLRELSKELDLKGDNGQPCPALVILVEEFGGFASKTIWDWLTSHQNCEKA